MLWYQQIKWGFIGLSIAFCAVSCGEGDSDIASQQSSTTSGTISISVDESYKPVIEQQLKVFDSSFPAANITEAFKTEKQCFEDLFRDSVRLILVSRDLTTAEKETYQKNEIAVKSLGVAMDAIAIVVNPKSVDTFMTTGILKEILLGKFVRPYTVVFDNAQSGTVRYMLDSLIPGQKLPSNTFAAKDNDAVLKYVAENEKAVGIVGVNHIYDAEDRSGVGAFKKEIRVVSVRNDSTGEFYQPYQAYIALKQYPLTRVLYFISRDTRSGLGAGFANFLCSERGQLIFYKSRMVPLRVELNIREAEIK